MRSPRKCVHDARAAPSRNGSEKPPLTQSHPEPDTEARSRSPGIVWVAYAFALAFCVAFAVQASVSYGYVGTVRDVGWTWTYSGGIWTVRDVPQGGPAAGILEPGDRILEIDGDSRLARIGPSWVIRNAPIGDRYTVTVDRAGSRIEVTLSQRTESDPTQRIWLIIQLMTALSFAVVAVIMVLARPDEEAIRGGFWGASLISVFYLWQSSDPYNGVLLGWALDLQFVLGSTFPLYLWGGYRFFAAFPDNRREEGRWALFLKFIFVAAWAIWLPRTIISTVQIPDSYTVSLVTALWPILWPYVRFGPVLETIFLTVMVTGSAAALARNYRRVGEGDMRRRIRWVAGSMMISAFVVVTASVIDVVARLVSTSIEADAFATQVKVISNFVPIVMPLALGYAIVRHRVMGIELVVRMGLRYLMARAVLQGVVTLSTVTSSGSSTPRTRSSSDSPTPSSSSTPLGTSPVRSVRRSMQPSTWTGWSFCSETNAKPDSWWGTPPKTPESAR